MNRLNNFNFVSNRHLRYENGIPVHGMQYCQRTIKIEEKNTGGGSYIVCIVMSDGVHPTWGDKYIMAPKPMKIVYETNDEIELRGFGYDPYGLAMGAGEEASFAHYGLSIIYENDIVDKCILHMHDRNINIEYYL